MHPDTWSILKNRSLGLDYPVGTAFRIILFWRCSCSTTYCLFIYLFFQGYDCWHFWNPRFVSYGMVPITKLSSQFDNSLCTVQRLLKIMHEFSCVRCASCACLFWPTQSFFKFWMLVFVTSGDFRWLLPLAETALTYRANIGIACIDKNIPRVSNTLLDVNDET